MEKGKERGGSEARVEARSKGGKKKKRGRRRKGVRGAKKERGTQDEQKEERRGQEEECVQQKERKGKKRKRKSGFYSRDSRSQRPRYITKVTARFRLGARCQKGHFSLSREDSGSNFLDRENSPCRHHRLD